MNVSIGNVPINTQGPTERNTLSGTPTNILRSELDTSISFSSTVNPTSSETPFSNVRQLAETVLINVDGVENFAQRRRVKVAVRVESVAF